LPYVPDRIAVRDPFNPDHIMYMNKQMFDELRRNVALDRSQQVAVTLPPHPLGNRA
jgi:hypothetical protein